MSLIDVTQSLEAILNEIDSKKSNERIDASIEYLKTKIWGTFRENLLSVDVFGSYDRTTYLSNDQNGDVDILIVFKENQYKPDTYLTQLKTFGEKCYPKSEIYPDHPTIAIELNHIKFELVPSYKTGGSFKIPAPRSNGVSWISTNPIDFKQKLLSKDKNNKGLIIPTIKLIKYWNLKNGKILDSFEIERAIIEKLYDCKIIKDYFFSAFSALLSVSTNEANRAKIKSALEILRKVKVLEKEGFNEYAVLELAKLFNL
ncbi:MAG: nucleotidyltransferase [Chitinophagaceae bacterium]|nr:MAG: nucleotidyltransferase [Chitinophagaceae bacterium]